MNMQPTDRETPATRICQGHTYINQGKSNRENLSNITQNGTKGLRPQGSSLCIDTRIVLT
jgi:hypothetical protein